MYNNNILIKAASTFYNICFEVYSLMKGKKSSVTLSWLQRLQILSDAAQGNEINNILFLYH